MTSRVGGQRRKWLNGRLDETSDPGYQGKGASGVCRQGSSEGPSQVQNAGGSLFPSPVSGHNNQCCPLHTRLWSCSPVPSAVPLPGDTREKQMEILVLTVHWRRQGQVRLTSGIHPVFDSDVPKITINR